MFNWIKKSCLNKYIADNKVARHKALTSIDRAKSIGMIASITDENSYINMFSIFSKLQGANKKTRMVAYIDDKTVPYYCLEQLTADYFCQKDLNWYGKPIMVQINDFMNIDFDMLIDFTKVSLLPVQTILSLSHAKMIVGANTHYRHDYDLFIDDPDLNEQEIFKYINLYSSKLTGEPSIIENSPNQ